VWAARRVLKLTRHGGRFFGSKRTWISMDHAQGRWVSGWEMVV